MVESRVTFQLVVHPEVTAEAVNRLLEVGRLLFSVLTPEEINELQEMLSNTEERIGNTGDS